MLTVPVWAQNHPSHWHKWGDKLQSQTGIQRLRRTSALLPKWKQQGARKSTASSHPSQYSFPVWVSVPGFLGSPAPLSGRTWLSFQLPLLKILCFATMLLVICYNFLCFQPRISKQLKGHDFPSSFCSEDHTSITTEKENRKNREITQIHLRAQKNTQWLSMTNKASSWWENSASFWKAVLLKYHPIDTFFKWPLK